MGILKTIENFDKSKKWDSTFMEMASLFAGHSSCVKRKVGAVLVKDNEIISYGYNHTVKGSQSCTKTSCIRTKNDIERLKAKFLTIK